MWRAWEADVRWATSCLGDSQKNRGDSGQVAIGQKMGLPRGCLGHGRGRSSRYARWAGGSWLSAGGFSWVGGPWAWSAVLWGCRVSGVYVGRGLITAGRVGRGAGGDSRCGGGGEKGLLLGWSCVGLDGSPAAGRSAWVGGSLARVVVVRGWRVSGGGLLAGSRSVGWAGAGRVRAIIVVGLSNPGGRPSVRVGWVHSPVPACHSHGVP